MRELLFKGYEEDGKKVLIYELPEEGDLDETTLDLCEAGELSCVVPTKYVDDADAFYYDLDGCKTFSKALKGEVDSSDVLELLYSFAMGLSELKEKDVPLQHLVLHRDFVYVDRMSMQVKLMLIPMTDDADVNAVDEIAKFIRVTLASLCYNINEDGTYVTNLLTLVNTPDQFNVNFLVNCLQELMDIYKLDYNSDSYGGYVDSAEAVEDEDIATVDPSVLEDAAPEEYAEEAPSEEVSVSETYEETAEEYETAAPETYEETPATEAYEETPSEESYEEVPVSDTYEDVPSEEEVPVEETVTPVEPGIARAAEVGGRKKFGRKPMSAVSAVYDDASDAQAEDEDDADKTEAISVDEQQKEALRKIAEAEAVSPFKDDEDTERQRFELDDMDGITENLRPIEISIPDGRKPRHSSVFEPSLDGGDGEEDGYREKISMRKKPRNPTASNRVAQAEAAKEEEKKEQQAQEEAAILPKVNPYLIRVNTNERIMITKQTFKIGKASFGMDYSVGDNGAISRNHCTIFAKDGVYYIRDNKSTNHTYVNGVMVKIGQDAVLTHESKVVLADEEFIFKLN